MKNVYGLPTWASAKLMARSTGPRSTHGRLARLGALAPAGRRISMPGVMRLSTVMPLTASSARRLTPAREAIPLSVSPAATVYGGSGRRSDLGDVRHDEALAGNDQAVDGEPVRGEQVPEWHTRIGGDADEGVAFDDDVVVGGAHHGRKHERGGAQRDAEDHGGESSHALPIGTSARLQ